jgi:hypothetical protein
MNRAINRTKDTLLEEGSCFPILTLYKKGSPIVVEEDSSLRGVILIKNSDDFEVVSKDFIAEDGEEIHTSHIVFKYGEGVDEKDINRAAKALTRKYEPDMVGLVMSCLYTDNGGDTPIHNNPDTTRLLHAVYYTKESKEGQVIFVPFINRGELPLEQQQASDGVNDPIVYDVTFVDSGWTTSNGKSVRPSINNPYSKR